LAEGGYVIGLQIIHRQESSFILSYYERRYLYRRDSVKPLLFKVLMCLRPEQRIVIYRSDPTGRKELDAGSRHNICRAAAAKLEHVQRPEPPEQSHEELQSIAGQ
jgi:hypothetical protein